MDCLPLYTQPSKSKIFQIIKQRFFPWQPTKKDVKNTEFFFWRQTDRQTERQTERTIERERDKQTDRQNYRQTYRQTGRQEYTRTDRRTDR